MQKLSLISVEPEPLPSFAEVMQDLEPFVRLLYESLDAGAAVCRGYYDKFCEGDIPEPYLREMMVRGQAKRYLTKNGLQVKKIKERGFSLVAEPLISLLIHYKGFALRVLKAKKGIPPGCGKSTRRKEFYNQVSVRYLGDDGKISGSKTNLLVFWDFSPGFGIANVWLACPEVAGARSQDVVLAWQEPIQNPVVVQGTATKETPAEAAQIEQRADQEIEELLLGTDTANASGTHESSSLKQEAPQAADTTSATELEEGADDRQSDKVGA